MKITIGLVDVIDLEIVVDPGLQKEDAGEVKIIEIGEMTLAIEIDVDEMIPLTPSEGPDEIVVSDLPKLKMYVFPHTLKAVILPVRLYPLRHLRK
jgi:hypothetical protein